MYNFKEIEESSRKVWKNNSKEIKKAVQDNTKKKIFSFLEGPPTANAPPGLHHLEVRTFKDIICKFKFMKGFSVPRKGGWDCHGLPVEVQIEKKLNLADKKAVLDYGVEKFINQCKESVFSNIKDWSVSTEELNYWIDLEHPYVTLENDYIESVWWSLKELYKKDLLYEGHKVVPFCPRCGTPLSSHEVAQGYKDITEESVYIAFKLKDKKDEYVLAWTTTPWTLPGNVGLAVGNKIEYVKIKLPDGDKLILGKDRLSLIKGDYQVIEKLKGKDLVGLEYEPLYDIKELRNKNSYKIIPADFVTTEDGTGVVHTAVMYGEDDYNIGIEKGLPAVHTVGQDGKFLDIAPEFLRGRFVKSAEKDIIEDLKKRHLLFKVEKITHAYPFCWRCDSPLLYYAINSWYIKVTKIRDRMVKLNKKINWSPKHIKDGRFGKWLEGAKDWALSRFKFWGTPLPIWRCSSGCGNEEIIGSIDELKKKSIKKLGKIDLHKPFIDKVELKCSKCKKNMKRIPDVIDCWYDSGSAIFAQFHYPFENKKEFERRFPYDFISEGIDQTRGWFYTMHVLSTALFDKVAYKNVICAGHIVDEKGEKMSKSKGNIIKPREIIDQAGVDAIRLQFCTNDAGNSKPFSFNLMREAVIPFLTILYNLNKYYSQMENKKCVKKIEDKWILSRLNSTIKGVTKNLEEFSIYEGFQKIMDFVVRDLSRNYIKMTRDREDNKEIVKECLLKTALILAPFAPYITENIYQNFEKKSIHLSSWPKAEENKIDKKLEKEFNDVLAIIEKGLAERDKAQIGLRWPLGKIAIQDKELQSLSKYEEIIKSQLNIKKIELKKGKELSVKLDTKMTSELEAEGYAREITRKIQNERKIAGLMKKDLIDLHISVGGLDFLKLIVKNSHIIQEKVNAKKISIGQFLKNREERDYQHQSEGEIKEKKFKIFFNKVK